MGVFILTFGGSAVAAYFTGGGAIVPGFVATSAAYLTLVGDYQNIASDNAILNNDRATFHCL